MCNIKALSLLDQKLLSRLSFFSKVGQKSRSRSRGKKFWFQQEGLATRNTHVKYESPISFGSKVVAKVKFFQKKVKSQGQGHKVKIFCIDRKVLSQGIHLCNIKALSLLVQKLWSRLSLLWTDGRTDGQTDRQTDRQGDSYIPPQTSFAGGINI